MSESLEPEASITVTSGVSVFTGLPFCGVEVNGVAYGQLTPNEVRMMALHWLGAAEAAESDAAVFAELKSADLEDAVAATFITNLRSRRADLQ